jgi:hypothetical protein
MTPPVAQPRGRGDDGAIAIVVAVCMVFLLAAAAIAVDASYLWSNRRGLVTATDAGALAAAEVYARGGNGCSTAATFVADNMAEATVDACNRTGDGRGGWVTLTTSTDPDLLFANVMGFETGHVEAETTAQYGIPSGMSGLRPFALCVESNGVEAWAAAGYPTPSATYRIMYTKDNPNDCGANAPGNWGILDFDGGANRAGDTREWTLNGYPGVVSVGEQVPGDTGAFSNSLNTELNTLVANGTEFPVPLFDAVTGNGSNASFRVEGFAMVQLVGFRTNGPEAQRYLEIRFVSRIAQGQCCDAGGPDLGLRVVRICAIEGLDPSSRCT